MGINHLSTSTGDRSISEPSTVAPETPGINYSHLSELVSQISEPSTTVCYVFLFFFSASFARFKIFSGDINNVDQLASWVDAAVGKVVLEDNYADMSWRI